MYQFLACAVTRGEGDGPATDRVEFAIAAARQAICLARRRCHAHNLTCLRTAEETQPEGGETDDREPERSGVRGRSVFLRSRSESGRGVCACMVRELRLSAVAG